MFQNDPTATDDAKRETASLFVEKFRKAFSESSELFAELDLYGSPEIAQRCGEFSYKYALYDNGQFDDFSRELGEIVELMRIDLVEIPLHSRR